MKGRETEEISLDGALPILHGRNGGGRNGDSVGSSLPSGRGGGERPGVSFGSGEFIRPDRGRKSGGKLFRGRVRPGGIVRDRNRVKGGGVVGNQDRVRDHDRGDEGSS